MLKTQIKTSGEHSKTWWMNQNLFSLVFYFDICGSKAYENLVAQINCICQGLHACWHILGGVCVHINGLMK